MSEINIFLKDIDVPEVVQKKADLAFLSIQTEGGKTMKKGYYKVLAAAAACAALIVAAQVSNGTVDRSGWDLQVKDNSEGGENSDNSVLAEIDRMFTLRVQAAELEAGHPVSLITDDNRHSFVLGATENEEIEEIDYCISAPFTCEGGGY